MSAPRKHKRRRANTPPDPTAKRRPPLVALVGRPNVGKSTLFNRLTGTRDSLVEDTPGVTRDRKYGDVEWNGLRFMLVDTGGFEPEPEHHILRAMRRQTQLAIDEADVVVFVTDARAGMTPSDSEIAEHLRRSGKPAFVAVNKVDSKRQHGEALEFHSLGLGDLFMVSAEHGVGMGDLLDAILAAFPQALRETARELVVEEEAAEDAAEEAEAEARAARALLMAEAEARGEANLADELYDDEEAFDEGDFQEDDGEEGGGEAEDSEAAEVPGDVEGASEMPAEMDAEAETADAVEGEDAFAEDASQALLADDEAMAMAAQLADNGDAPPAKAPEELDLTQVVQRVAVIGRPNAGKSTLINRLLGEERLLTFHEPGTTRDSVDTWLVRGDRRFVLIDTAGIRRQRSIHDPLERMCVARSLDAIDRSDVTWLLIDAEEGVTEQDAKVAAFAHEKGRALVLVLNKIDLLPKGSAALERLRSEIERKLQFVSYAPVVHVSARTGTRVNKLLETSDEVFTNHARRITTGRLNRFFRDVLVRHPPPTQGARMVKLYFIVQVGVRPPTFMVSVNYPKSIHFSYQRYVVNQLRKAFGFDGTPVRVIYRTRERSAPRIRMPKV